jgi:hypothetical protein
MISLSFVEILAAQKRTAKAPRRNTKLRAREWLNQWIGGPANVNHVAVFRISRTGFIDYLARQALINPECGEIASQ